MNSLQETKTIVRADESLCIAAATSDGSFVLGYPARNTSDPDTQARLCDVGSSLKTPRRPEQDPRLFERTQ